MINNYFRVLRAGSHTTFQDEGFTNLQHLGITTGGIVDKELFCIANSLVGNSLSTPIMEFANMGPMLKLISGKCRFAITGNIYFNIISKGEIKKGECNRTYNLKEGDVLDILSTIKSNYGYLSIDGGFKLNSEFNSFSTLTNSKIGSNNGKSLFKNQKIFFYKQSARNVSYINTNSQRNIDNIIRVVPGLQMNYFMIKMINKFLNHPYKISHQSNRMGIRLSNNPINSIISHDIYSEAIIKGSIQVPANGDPIVLLNDHPTIGGYPKIATVILSDISKLAQYPVGTEFFFKKITLEESEKIFLKKINKLKKDLLKIKSI